MWQLWENEMEVIVKMEKTNTFPARHLVNANFEGVKKKGKTEPISNVMFEVVIATYGINVYFVNLTLVERAISTTMCK